MNPYQVLGIEKNATEDEIKKAYRQAAKQHHPDVNPDDADAANRFKEIQNAYDLLTDPVKKSRFDGGGFPFSAKHYAPAGSSFEDVMEQFFGGSKYKGRNIAVRIEIELIDVLKGCTKYVKIKKQKPCVGCRGQGYTEFKNCSVCNGAGFIRTYEASYELRHPCKSCNGSGKYDIVLCDDCAGTAFLPGYVENDVEITVPPGFDSGMQLRLLGQGEESLHSGGQSGDVIVFVIVKDHPLFKREGANLLLEVPVSYTQLVFGDEIELPTLEDKIKVKIPAGSQSHTKFRIKGKGLSLPKGHGDLIATVKIEVTKDLNEKARKIFEELAEIEKQNITPAIKKWRSQVDSNYGKK